MKKFIKRAGITTLVVLALFGAGTGIAFASGYITWGGTQDYQETINLLEQLDRRSSELGSERSQMIRELIARTEIIEDKENELLDKDNQIDSLEQEIEALEKRIEGGQTSQDQLKQAEQDMNDVKNKTQEVLENMSRNFSQ